MNKKVGGLGRGLGALIPENDTQSNDGIIKININKIKPNEKQPRKTFDQEKLNLLSESIKDNGIIQPIVLQKDGDNFIIVAGERRWRASKLAGLKEVPAVILELTNKQVLEISLIENLQREDLNPIEEALAFKRLIDEYDLTQDELAAKVGRSRTSVTNSLRLLQLDTRVQEYLIEGVITEGHGRAILGIKDSNKQYELAQHVIDEGLSVRQIESLVKRFNSNVEAIKETTKKNNTNPYLNDIKYRLENRFNTRVSVVNNKNNKGKIEIEYYSQDDLNRILELFNI